MPVTSHDLASLPKVELHVHLEGTVTAEVARNLASRRGLDPDTVLPLTEGEYPVRFVDFGQFVALYLAVSRQIRTPDDLTTVAADFARRLAAQGARYAEVTFTALTHVSNGMEPAAMWAALRDGLAEGRPGVEIGLIVDAVRDLGRIHAERTVALVGDADAPVVGLGLTGLEGSAPESEFVALRHAADALGLGLAVHAGETGTAANVRRALDDLGADRIGHGIAAVTDPELLARLTREGTPLEICPSSNVTLGVVPSLAEHPLPRLAAAGANVTVHSDDPPFFATTLTEELARAADLLDLDRGGLADLQRRAARAAFAPAARRRELVTAIDAWESEGGTGTPDGGGGRPAPATGTPGAP